MHAQVCASDADVKRALRAWEACSTTGQAPMEAYSQGLPRKHTLEGLWAGAGKGSGEAGPQAGPQQKRARLAQGNGDSAAAGSTWLADARRREPAAGGGAAACGGPGQQAHASASELRRPAGTPAIDHDRSAEPAAQNVPGSREKKEAAIDLITPEGTPDRAQPPCEPSTNGRPQHGSSAGASSREGAAAGKNAFSVLMRAAKSPPKQAPSSGGGAAPAAARGGAWGHEWRDALRQVAMHPDRQAPRFPGPCSACFVVCLW